MLSPQRAAEFRKAASRSVPTKPQEDSRTHPAHHRARGFAVLPAGGRKRQIAGVL